MQKPTLKAVSKSRKDLEKLKKNLGGDCACFVLITCTQPSRTGEMQVEMNYEGDESLASFLVENASQIFDDQLESRVSR